MNYPRRKKISNGVKIIIKNFQKKIPVNPKRIKKTILNILSTEAIKKSGEIGVCFVSDRNIKKLNLKYRGENKATDVLAFDTFAASKPHPSGCGKDRPRSINPERSRRIDFSQPKGQKYISGDIVISADAAIRQARIFKTNVFYELNLYAVHGILHLLGYRDRTTREKRLMRKKEREYAHT